VRKVAVRMRRSLPSSTAPAAAIRQSLDEYLPEPPNYGRPVLLRDLIYQTSGLRDYIS
jgi:hypothetical protein